MQVTASRKFIGRFEYGKDLLGALTDICSKENVRLGTFFAIGALTKAKLGYYKQDEKRYVECVNLDKKLEIASCVGNISLKDNNIFVHAHITLADHSGQTCAGHLMPGAEIFAAEYYIQELGGGALERKDDKITGLSLW